jgi:hypothetical protein
MSRTRFNCKANDERGSQTRRGYRTWATASVTVEGENDELPTWESDAKSRHATAQQQQGQHRHSHTTHSEHACKLHYRRVNYILDRTIPAGDDAADDSERARPPVPPLQNSWPEEWGSAWEL